MQEDWTEALRIAEGAARDAGEIIMRGFRSGGDVSRKGKFDLVTEFDLASERLIRDRLQASFPGHRIVGEEGDPTGEGDLVWYVDPIDGTVNFAHGHPYFAVSIGLYRGTEGIVGVVHAPRLGQTWTAAKGFGASCNGEPCHVSNRTSLDEALCTTGFPGNVAMTDDTNEAEVGAFLRSTRGVRRCGSAALDLVFVADGTYDLYWERHLKAWDIAGGCVVVSEAQGRLSDYEGGQIDPTEGELVASNGLLHDVALQTITQARGGVS
jgi:myo-inositol-1(or 4)-monophosphatase